MYWALWARNHKLTFCRMLLAFLLRSNCWATGTVWMMMPLFQTMASPLMQSSTFQDASGKQF